MSKFVICLPLPKQKQSVWIPAYLLLLYCPQNGVVALSPQFPTQFLHMKCCVERFWGWGWHCMCLGHNRQLLWNAITFCDGVLEDTTHNVQVNCISVEVWALVAVLYCFVPIFIFVDGSSCPHHLCLLVYQFPPGFIPLLFSHGNAKGKTPFFPMWPSTFEHIKSECMERGPKGAIDLVFCCRESYRCISPRSASLRWRAGVMYMKEREVKRAKWWVGCLSRWPLLSNANSLHRRSIVQTIRAAPDPAILLADDCQINDFKALLHLQLWVRNCHHWSKILTKKIWRDSHNLPSPAAWNEEEE